MQSLLTSTATGLILTLPVRAGVDAQNSVEFVGFNFLPGQACDPPGAWACRRFTAAGSL